MRAEVSSISLRNSVLRFRIIVTLLPTITKGIESVNSIGEVLLSEDVECNEGKEKLADVEGVFSRPNQRAPVPSRDGIPLSGRLHSKIMRDVEAVETLSTQMFLSILNIALNIAVALVVTGTECCP